MAVAVVMVVVGCEHSGYRPYRPCSRSVPRKLLGTKFSVPDYSRVPALYVRIHAGASGPSSGLSSAQHTHSAAFTHGPATQITSISGLKRPSTPLPTTVPSTRLSTAHLRAEKAAILRADAAREI